MMLNTEQIYANAKFYVAVYDDRGSVVAISDKNRDNINIKKRKQELHDKGGVVEQKFKTVV